MLNAGEVAEALADTFLLYACDIRCDTGCETVVEVVFTGQAELFLLHVERCWLLNLVLSFLDVGNASSLLEFRERINCGMNVELLKFLLYHRIVVPVDESIDRSLILSDAHLRVGIVLELEVVTVEVVRRDVQQDGDVSTEVIHVVKLERAQLNDVIFVRILSHLKGETATDITSQSGIIACTLEDVIDEAGGSCLTVRACDANHLRVGVATGKLNLTDDMGALLHQLLNHRSFLWYARALDNLIGIEDFLLCVMTFLPLNVVAVEQFLIFVLYL